MMSIKDLPDGGPLTRAWIDSSSGGKCQELGFIITFRDGCGL
jgi:hypothetical protein